MSSNSSIQLQLSLDMTDKNEALRMASSAYPSLDIVEIGTPLLIKEGLSALELIKKEFPDTLYLADAKIVDAGYFEASSASVQPMGVLIRTIGLYRIRCGGIAADAENGCGQQGYVR